MPCTLSARPFFCAGRKQNLARNAHDTGLRRLSMKRAPSATRGCVRRSTARVSASRAQREALLVCRAMAIRGRGGASVEQRAVAGGRRSGSRAATFAPRALCTGERAVHASFIILFATPRVLCGPFPLTTFGLLTPCQKTVKKPNVSMCNVTWGSQIVFRGNSPSFAPVPANGQPRKCPHRRGRNRGLGENGNVETRFRRHTMARAPR